MTHSFTVDRQVGIHLQTTQNGHCFRFQGKGHHLPTLEKVHEFFRNQAEFDTVKLSHDGKKSYLHFHLDEFEVYDSKQALRKTLSQESGGAWVEEKEGQKRYFIEDKGWLKTTYTEVMKNTFYHQVEASSALQSTTRVGLYFLSLVSEVSKYSSIFPWGKDSMGFLLQRQQASLFGALGLLAFSNAEFQVHTNTAGDQAKCRVSGLIDGGFIAVWESDGQDGDSWGIFGQRFDLESEPVGVEFQVNNFTSGAQRFPSVTYSLDGGYFIVWESAGQDGSLIGIFGRGYSNLDMPIGDEFQVNSYFLNDQRRPKIATIQNGGYVIAWHSDIQDGDSMGIFAQKYYPNRTKNGGEFQVNTYTISQQSRCSVATLLDGGFVVTWESLNQDGTGWGIYAQNFDSNGMENGPEYLVNSYPLSSQLTPDVSAFNQSHYVIVWHSNEQDGDSWGIYGQRYFLNGSLMQGEFQVHTNITGSQEAQSVSQFNHSGFVVIWESAGGQDGDGRGIFGQLFRVDGDPIGMEFQVNNYSVNHQRFPDVASLSDGGFIVVWESYDQDGNSSGVYGQRYNSDGLQLHFQHSISETSQPQSSSINTVVLGKSTESTMISAPRTSQILLNITSENMNSMEVVSSPQSETDSTTISSTQTAPTGNLPPSLLEIEYSAPYPITYNGQQIGTFSITGGEGQFSTSNSNTLVIELTVDYQILDGQVITLFSDVSDDLVWDDIVFLNGDGECFDAEGQFVENERGGNDYTLIFEVTSGGCEIVEGSQLAPMTAMLALQ